MSPTVLYTILFICLGGLIAVLVSKMSFVDRFLSKKKALMESTMMNQNDRKKDRSSSSVTLPAMKSRTGFFYKIKEKLQKRADSRKQDKLKKIEQKRIDRMNSMQKDTVIEKKNFQDEIPADPTPTVPTFSQAQTVKPIKRNRITKDHDKEETRLINRIALHPQNKENYRVLGDFYLKYGKLDDARECYKHVLKIDAKDDEAQEKIQQLSVNSR